MEKRIIHSKNIRQHNKEIVVETLRKHSSLTKTSIASKTKLSFPAVSSILDVMLQTKELLSVSKTSSGGRPAEHFSLNPDFYYTLCVYLEKHIVHYQLYDYKEKIISTKKVVVIKNDLKTMIYECNLYLKKFPKITAICFGLPAVFKEDIILLMPDYYSFKDVCLKDYFDDSINIYFENDANVIAYGYYQKHLNTTPYNYAHIVVGDNGPGVGLVINNQLVKGDFHYAGEILDLPINNSVIKEVSNQNIIKALEHLCYVYSSIVNPKYIGISGASITKEIIDSIKKRESNFIPVDKQATIIYCSEVEEIYFNGLLNLSKNRKREK